MPNKMMREESIPEIHMSSQHQKNQSVHEVDEFREEDWKQLDREGSCPKREFRNSDRGYTRDLGRGTRLANQAKGLGTESQE